MSFRCRRAILLALLISFVACSKKPTKTKLESEDQMTEKPTPATLEDFDPIGDRGTSEMNVVLSEGAEDADPYQPLPTADVKKLSVEQTALVLDRLPQLKEQADDRSDFAKRADSLPPPRTGETIETAFPPDEERVKPSAVDVADTALKVLRKQPEGNVPIVPHLSVTFNKPMVTIASHADTIAENVPVKLTPKPDGQWRWIGSKTLLFEPAGGRFPMATEYRVEIPAGTKAANDETLAKTATWTFSTPPPTVKNSYPQRGTFGLDQLMFMSFDQKIDQAELVEHISLNTGGIFSKSGAVLAEPERIDADDTIKQLVENAQPDRYIVVRARGDLPYNQRITATLKEGAPSAEGPRRTESPHSFSFQTHGPLNVTRNRCGYNQCNPRDSFSFRFSNRLDPEKFDESLVDVKPSFPTMNVQQNGQWIQIYGQKPGRRTYTVTIDRELTDEFGQTLQGENTFTFEVGPSHPQMYSTSNTFSVLDPSADPTFTIFTTNYAEVRLRAWRVEPRDWGDYLAWMHDHRYYGKKEKKAPGELVIDQKVKLDAKPDELVQTDIALSEGFGENDRGNLVVHVEPARTTRGSSMPDRPPDIRSWVQATDIGLDAFVDSDEFLAWVTTLDGGETIEDARVELAVSGQTAQTDGSGLAKIDLVGFRQEFANQPNMLVATHGDDEAFLPENMWGRNHNTSWVEKPTHDSLAWFVFDDRQMYRPQETVTVKGWMRAIEHREEGMVKLATGVQAVDWTVYGPQGNEITSGKTKTTELGGFSLNFDLPETPNLGQARLQLTARGASETNTSHNHTFQIQEFRTPEFEVTASTGEGPFLAGESALATVEAKYYAGGALPGADVTWNVSTNPASYTPPNQNEYTFGSWTPWWARASSQAISTPAQTFQSKTDATGTHSLKMSFSDIAPPRPMSVRAQATVMDVNRQAWTATSNLIVHPSDYYVGMKTERYFVERGDPLEVELIASDIDGNRVAERPVKVRASRVQYRWKAGKYEEVEKEPQTCEIVTAEEPSNCTFETKVGGTYKIVATTVDDEGRLNFTEFTRWVSGGERPVARRVEKEEIQLIPDKDEYHPGETAELLVQSPIVPAELLYMVQRNGMVVEKRVTMSEPTTTLVIPVKNTHYPNFHVQVNVVGSQPRLDASGEPDESLPRRPAYGEGNITLKVPPSERELSVALEPAESRVAPAVQTSATVTVKDAEGKPVPDAEVAIVVVDEAILALSDYSMADPMNVFYPQRPAGVRSHYLRSSVALVDPSNLVAVENQATEGGVEHDQGEAPPSERARRPRRKMKKAMPAPMAMGEAEAPATLSMALETDMFDAGAPAGAPDAQPIAVRSNFDPLATFAPAVKTDSAGKATVEYEMPDNLTRYRIMAVAVHGGTKYGTGESNVTARLPLMVRPSPPRFLNFGDRFDLPVVLQNQTDDQMTVHVATRGTNVEFVEATGWQVQVPANDRVEVRFPARTALAGTARFQVGASAGKSSDASEFDLPVWTPATSEAFATYGVVDDGSVVQPVSAPTDVWPQFGGLEITTSSTALQALTDAFIYLYGYQYQCAEQISSRMVSVAALRDVLSAFQAEGMPTKAELERSMSRDIEELQSRQNYDGGFGVWRRGQISWPYVSIHATHALTRAKQKGYEVAPQVMQRSKSYLQGIERYIPGWWPQWIRLHAIAYSLYVRGLMGDDDPAKAREVIRRGGELENLSFESVGWLLGAMTGHAGYESDTAEIRRFLNNRVTETSAGAHFAARTDDADYVIMRSDRVADGVILEALIDDQPKSDLIPKIVNGLLAHRKKGRWGNTQENSFILLALDKYFNTFEKETPNFVARMWLGDRFAGEHRFKGRTTERHHVGVPMKYLVDEGGDPKLYLQKDGKGRMYYRIGMDYAPKSLFLEPADHGFVVQRGYEPVDDDDDVKRRSDGAWEIKAGAKVRVKLTMVAPTRRYHVALVDPLPAGLETLNPALAVTGDVPQDPNANTGRSSTHGWWWWTRPWFEHQNMRDERTEAFTTLLWGGVHSYTYYARATTPGEFVVPPTKAEEMYHPETFGRSGSDRVFVVD